MVAGSGLRAGHFHGLLVHRTRSSDPVLKLTLMLDTGCSLQRGRLIGIADALLQSEVRNRRVFKAYFYLCAHHRRPAQQPGFLCPNMVDYTPGVTRGWGNRVALW